MLLKRWIWVSFVAGFLISVDSPFAQAVTTYYVDPDGSDSYDGSAASHTPMTTIGPFETVQKAIDLCTNTSETYVIRLSGETHLPVKATLYYLFWIDGKKNITIEPTSGTPILSGDGGKYPSKDAKVPTDTSSLGLLEIRNSQNITISGIHVKDSGQAGITVREHRDTLGTGEVVTSDITIEDCHVENARSWGIVVEGREGGYGPDADEQPYDITVRRNEIETACSALNVLGVGNAAGEALRIHNTDHFFVYHNHIYDHYKEGIDIINGSTDGEVYRNLIGPRKSDTIYGGKGAGIYIDASTLGVDEIDVYDNVVEGDGTNEAQGIVLGSERGGDLDDIDIFNNVVSGVSLAAFCMCGDTNQSPPSPGTQTNIRVFQNTFVGKTGQHVVNIQNNGNAGNPPTIPQKLTGFNFENNIVARETSDTTALFKIESPVSSSSFTLDFNLYYAGGGTINGALGTNTIEGDPDFTPTSPSSVNVGDQYITVDYDIGSLSEAIDPSGAEYTIASPDIRGVTRDAGDYDIGAFEYQ